MDVSVWIALGAGLASFLSPCVLPIVPTYLVYLTGYSVGDMAEGKDLNRGWVLLNASLFIAGFSTVFILFGLSASFIGQVFLRNQLILTKIGGIVVIVFGLHKIGLFKLRPLLKEKRLGFVPKKAGLLNSLLMGMAFSIGWTPCIGPVLGSILMIAGTHSEVLWGAILLAFYSLGLAVPFFLTALGLTSLFKYFGKAGKYLPAIEVVSGVLLVIIGIMIYTGYFTFLSSYFG